MSIKKFPFILYSLFFILYTLPLRAAVLENPLGTEDPMELWARILKSFLGVVGVVSLAFFIIGGLTIITAGGNPEKIKKGKDTLIWAVVGIIIVFWSYVILKFIFKMVLTPTG